jgi:hypothetical protein
MTEFEAEKTLYDLCLRVEEVYRNNPDSLQSLRELRDGCFIENQEPWLFVWEIRELPNDHQRHLLFFIDGLLAGAKTAICGIAPSQTTQN